MNNKAMKIRELSIKLGIPLQQLKYYATHPSFPEPVENRAPKRYDPVKVQKWLNEKPDNLTWKETEKYHESWLTINEICLKLGLKPTLFRYYELKHNFPKPVIKNIPRRYDIEEIEQWLDTYHGKRLYDNEDIIEFKNPTLSIKFLAGHFDPKYRRRKRLTPEYNPAKTKVVRLRQINHQ